MKNIKYILFILLLMPTLVFADDTNITSKCKFTVEVGDLSGIIDDDFSTIVRFSKDEVLNISCEDNIKYVYIKYNGQSSKGKITDDNNSVLLGQNNYLHELVELDSLSTNINLTYDEDYQIADIYVFTIGTLPSWVEKWESLDDADLMLFSTHADDEQLFFLGLMPKYVSEGKKIQVVYFTNHFNNRLRYHEQLEGLWAVGVKYYPVISNFPDAYSESYEAALANLEKAGFTKDDALLFEVNQIRKYKPEVVVGHDINGEYGHGQHILNTNTLIEAIDKAKDSSYLSDYEPFAISKLYLHLYEQNQITLDYNTPLEYFNNQTAYEVSKLGYAKHLSQQYTWFTSWINGVYTEGNEYYDKYAPYKFGLYYTGVGEDTLKNDMFENIVLEKETLDEEPTPLDKIKNDSDEYVMSKETKLGITIMCAAIGGGLILFFCTRSGKKD